MDLSSGPTLRALKVAVIVMGVLIVAGTIVVFATIATRLAGSARSGGTAAGELAIEGTVLDMAATAERIVLRVRRPDGGERLLLLDPQSGALAGTVELK